MKYTVINQWRPRKDDLCILYLGREKIVASASDDFRNYRIDGVVYKPVSMSHWNGRVIAIKGEGNFIGKEVEFIK